MKLSILFSLVTLFAGSQTAFADSGCKLLSLKQIIVNTKTLAGDTNHVIQFGDLIKDFKCNEEFQMTEKKGRLLIRTSSGTGESISSLPLYSVIFRKRKANPDIMKSVSARLKRHDIIVDDDDFNQDIEIQTKGGVRIHIGKEAVDPRINIHITYEPSKDKIVYLSGYYIDESQTVILED